MDLDQYHLLKIIHLSQLYIIVKCQMKKSIIIIKIKVLQSTKILC